MRLGASRGVDKNVDKSSNSQSSWVIARLRQRLLSEANVIRAGMLYHSLTAAGKKLYLYAMLSVIELLFLSLRVGALQGKMCQNSLPSGGGGSLSAMISGGRGRPPANMLIPLERQLIALQLCC